MARIIEYPRASLRAALQLADAIDGFAGSCSVSLAAEKLGKKVSGAFQAQIGSSVKFGLINSKAGKLSVSPLYRNYKLAYTPDDAQQYLREALLSPPLFNAIFNRFKGQKLPVNHFEKMLIKEFNVPDEIASRVSGYFLDGIKQAGLLSSDNTLINDTSVGKSDVTEDDKEPVFESDSGTSPSNDLDAISGEGIPTKVISSSLGEDYHLSIKGAGISFAIEIKDTDDLEIVQIMLKKIEKALRAKSKEE